MNHDYHTIDRLALLVGGGLVLLGTVVLGIVEVLAGEPYGAASITNEAGEIVASPFVDPNVRTGLVILGLLLLLLWGIYRMAAPSAHVEGPTHDAVAAE